ncbi:hypothetical protein [Fictibacillus gelatini]|uniref:hypothetical protein n=1 Tax=Fictibacillus gelatini TaxID=225985 RepID=UPI000409E930|nr:hypothetical protein [Fictibacillus gelatini]
MGFITLRERSFLCNYLSSLQNVTTLEHDKKVILSLFKKLSNPYPYLPYHLSREETDYLIQKLSDRLDDAYDSRNDYEIKAIERLTEKFQDGVHLT